MAALTDIILKERGCARRTAAPVTLTEGGRVMEFKGRQSKVSAEVPGLGVGSVGINRWRSGLGVNHERLRN